MDSHDLTVKHLDSLFVKLAPMARYLKKFENWMHHVGFPAHDELVEQASRLIAGVARGW